LQAPQHVLFVKVLPEHRRSQPEQIDRLLSEAWLWQV